MTGRPGLRAPSNPPAPVGFEIREQNLQDVASDSVVPLGRVGHRDHLAVDQLVLKNISFPVTFLGQRQELFGREEGVAGIAHSSSQDETIGGVWSNWYSTKRSRLNVVRQSLADGGRPCEFPFSWDQSDSVMETTRRSPYSAPAMQAAIASENSSLSARPLSS
jgi:hypothetical protein